MRGAGISWQLPVATSAANGWRQLDDNAQWTGPSMAECAQLSGRRAVVDILHQPTALQARRGPPLFVYTIFLFFPPERELALMNPDVVGFVGCAS